MGAEIVIKKILLFLGYKNLVCDSCFESSDASDLKSDDKLVVSISLRKNASKMHLELLNCHTQNVTKQL
tara:strand:+ start:344 stop:550 length:207 start_codon:yes stop_codon:yes gene_type:complete